MSAVIDFLNTLDRDATALQAYQLDAKGMLAKFGLKSKHGLTDAEQEALLTGDEKQLAIATGVSENMLNAIEVTHCHFASGSLN